MILAVRSSPVSPSGHDLQQPIASLPKEILQHIISFLSAVDTRSVALVSKALYPHASELLWRTVCLTDKSTRHLREDEGDEDRDDGDDIASEHDTVDEHDDTPMILKLYALAKYPKLASQVRVLTHRCHLPTPTIFSELPIIHFDGPNLSCDHQLLLLLRLAIRNMVNVKTLRIVYGHWHVTKILLEGFLDPGRVRPISSLWLESSSLKGARIDFKALSDHGGLESIRLRRLRIESSAGHVPRRQFPDYVLARGGVKFQLRDGAGGWITAGVQFSHVHAPQSYPQVEPDLQDGRVIGFDSFIWNQFPEISSFVLNNALSVTSEPVQALVPEVPLQHLFAMSTKTLTRLNIDWIIWRPYKHEDYEEAALYTLNELSKMRFPQLRAFQLRNAVVPLSRLPPDVYLFESMFLDFLEAHTRLVCLAWPLDRFYSHIKPSQDILSRSRQLVAHLGRQLIDLRLDSYYHSGDMASDRSFGDISKEQEKIRRHRFISEFAPFMTKLESIKLEGGIPRDEKREILRALHFCPLKKIILIGVTFPVGNTWGHKGDDLRDLDEGYDEGSYDLEEEDKDALVATFAESLPQITPFEFHPIYGWPPGPPFLHSIATHHAETVEELKLCGYTGCPVLSNFLPITKPLLYPLQHFHNLRQLVISVWLLTWFEDGYRDTEIISSWKDTRSPSSTALVVVTPPVTPPAAFPSVAPTVAPDSPNPLARHQEFNRWGVALKTRFSPSALAYRVAEDIGPYLSPIAKERPGGVRVRASFCLGNREEDRWASDIFDLDIKVGSGDKVLEFIGPREEGESGRWWDKLENRRWF